MKIEFHFNKGALMNGKLIFKNASYLFVGNVLIRFITAFATILIARYFGAYDYGILSIALAFAAVAGYFTDLGVTHTLIREATKKDANLPILMSSFLRTRIILAILTIIITIVIVEVFYSDSFLKKIIYVVVLPTIFGAGLQGVGAAYFQVTQQMHFTAIIRTVSGLFTASTLILGIIFKWPLEVIGPVYGVSSILGGLLSVYLVVKRINIKNGWDRNILNGIWSFTIAGFAIMLFPQLGPIILEKSINVKAVGYFAAAYRIPSVLYQIPGVVAAAFYPNLFHYGNQNKIEEHFKLSIIQLKVMSSLGILISLPFFFYAEWWIEMLFGKEWLQAAVVLKVLSFMIILQSISYPLADSLTTIGKQINRTYIMMFGLFIGSVSYFILGKRYGILGGGISALLIEIILITGFTIYIQNGIKLLIKGISINVFSLLLSILSGLFIANYLNPYAGIILINIIYATFVLLLDKNLRVYLLNWLKNIRVKFKKESI
jgi:O-antigen/teichoic acid export membrane protein